MTLYKWQHAASHLADCACFIQYYVLEMERSAYTGDHRLSQMDSGCAPGIKWVGALQQITTKALIASTMKALKIC